MQCDVYLHSSLPVTESVRAILYSQLAGGTYAGRYRSCDELPLRDRLTALGRGRPPVMATPLLPRYADWTRWTFERLGWDAREFAGYRLVMKYPLDSHGVLVLRYALPEKPAQ